MQNIVTTLNTIQANLKAATFTPSVSLEDSEISSKANQINILLASVKHDYHIRGIKGRIYTFQLELACDKAGGRTDKVVLKTKEIDTILLADWHQGGTCQTTVIGDWITIKQDSTGYQGKMALEIHINEGD